MPQRSWILLIAVVALLGAGLGFAWRAGAFDPPRPQVRTTGTAAIGGPFQLVNQDGQPVDQTILNGKWSAVFFGFTYCPDVCPTTLQTLAAAKQELGDKAKDLQVVFISVDPQRDTPEQLKAYLSLDAFPPGTIGLTGTPEQVDAVAKAYRAYHQKNGDGDDYLIDHSTMTYLMNPRGEFNTVIAHNTPPAEVAAKIKAAMAE
jgi:protein SCO1/2